MPTHRHHPENQQDPIRFGNLVKAMEQSLRQQYGTRDVRPLMRPFVALEENREFWNHMLDGLAILAATDQFRVYRLQRPVPELSIVADSYHIRPLIRILQSADRYQILGLNRREIVMFEGNRDSLDPMDLPEDVPSTITAALGEQVTEPQVMVAPHGTGPHRAGMHYGHGSKKDDVDIDAERFFRAVDRGIMDHCSRPSGLPLLLAALPEHHALFRRVSHNPFLMEEAIDAHPDTLSLDELRQRAWKVVEPQYLARLAAFVDMFNVGKPRGLSDDDLARVAHSAIAGKVATLLVEAERVVGGKIDRDTGEIHYEDLTHPGVDDLLDDLAEVVLRNGGQVIIVPAARMPSQSGIAALYRF
jgi:hypothetical protein